MEKQALLSGKVSTTPIAKPRPKFRIVKNKFSKGSTVMTYYPGDYMKEEESLSLALAELRKADEVFLGPVAVDAICLFPLPKSLSKKEKGERMAIGWHTQKPDADNVGKFICDAMNQIRIWADDCQVADLRIRKRWSEEPGIFISVDAL